MSLDAIWDAPAASPPKSTPTSDDPSVQKRPRQSLFFSDSDSDDERPPKRATAAPTPSAHPDLDALFEAVDKDEEDADLRYKPLAPSLDLAKLAKEADARHARARPAAASQSANSSKTYTVAEKDTSKDGGKDESVDGEKRARKAIPKLDEERLIGSDGFPALIEGIKGFKPRRGDEHSDLSRLLRVYQFWTHKLFPKTSFRDTVNRVEKLCHSKRMQVQLSVWRDEFKGVADGKNLGDDPDVIDLTETTLVATGNDGDAENPDPKDDEASSRTHSLPPASSEVEDDDFDIDAVIKAEEERLATLRSVMTDAESLQPSYAPALVEKVPSAGIPKEAAMDVDEAQFWEGLDDLQVSFDPSRSGPSRSAPAGDDDEMWDIVDEVEQGERYNPTKTRIPISEVNLEPSLNDTHSGNVSRPTNDEDWDEMYL